MANKINVLQSREQFVPQPRLFLDQPFFPHNFAIRMGLELRKYCIVGGNAVSAFLSWRLQATNACDVTLVWKANFQAVAQYGISFKYVVPMRPIRPYDPRRELTNISCRSQRFGNERFKPRHGKNNF